MTRQVRKKDPEPRLLCAYDYETTRIAKGTPRPLYLTAMGRRLPVPFDYASPIKDMTHLQWILVTYFLTPENHNVMFVAWNGNNFDAYFTAAALVTHPDFVMRPYLTRSKALRGIRVIRREHINDKHAPCWEFVDGIAMTGLVGVKLAKFLQTFAPHLPKMENVINFEEEEFDCTNPLHCDYAMRDSDGLDFAINNAQDIMLRNFGQPLAVTMGGACIKILKAHIPEDVTVRALNPKLKGIVRGYVMRGGYCYCVRRFEGPVWKYDLNQAYASAMRVALLPAGGAMHQSHGLRMIPADGEEFQRHDSVMVPSPCYIVRIEARHDTNQIPFYCRGIVNGHMRSLFARNHIPDSWITSIEHRQLLAEGWQIEIKESYGWDRAFNLADYVNKLERRRMTCDGGPSGPEGTMIKATGNHSYGKMLEELENIEYVLASECPEGFSPHYTDGDTDPLEHIFERVQDDMHPKDYHQPHIGAFITAHVRMVVRQAALIDPGAWLYADTDCVVFSRDVTDRLDIDAKRYGAWKIEEAGTQFQIIAKKVYANVETGEGSAKGLHVRKVTPAQFTEWLAGKPPVQTQVQRNNFVAVMKGAEMYREQTRAGTATEGTA